MGPGGEGPSRSPGFSSHVPGLTPLPPEAAKVLPTQLLPLLGCVRRKFILHENDLACVSYQRALKNLAALGRPFDRV